MWSRSFLTYIKDIVLKMKTVTHSVQDIFDHQILCHWASLECQPRKSVKRSIPFPQTELFWLFGLATTELHLLNVMNKFTNNSRISFKQVPSEHSGFIVDFVCNSTSFRQLSQLSEDEVMLLCGNVTYVIVDSVTSNMIMIL